MCTATALYWLKPGLVVHGIHDVFGGRFHHQPSPAPCPLFKKKKKRKEKSLMIHKTVVRKVTETETTVTAPARCRVSALPLTHLNE